MRRFFIRRAIGALLSLAIVAGAPGSDAYQAFAQAGRPSSTSGRGASAPHGAVAAVPGLSAPIPFLAPAAGSLALSAPAVVPGIGATADATLAVAARVAPAVEAEAVPMGTARADAPSALTRALSAADTERKDGSGNMFDGAAARKPSAEPVAASARRGSFGRSISKGLAIAALCLGMLGVQHDVRAQSLPEPPPPVAQSGVPVAGAAARAALPRPVEARAEIDRQGVTVGERVRLTFTLRNSSDQPLTLQNLRGAVQDALPADLELQNQDAEAPLTLAPGESKTVSYEAIPFGAGTLTLDGGIAVVSVAETSAFPEGIEIVLPKTELTVQSVLTPDWRQKGLRDIVGVKSAAGPDWLWLAAIPLGILMFVGVHRLVAARRLYPKLDARRLSLVAVTEAELARLRAESEGLDAAAFYARYQDLLTGFMVDFAGLPRAARDARALQRDLRRSPYDEGQASTAARLAAAAEAGRFAGTETDPSERMRALDRFQALLASVAGKAGKSKAEDRGLFAALALLPGAAGLAFGSPWVLILLVPLAAYLMRSRRSRAASERFAVSSAAQTPARRTLRERFAGLPRVLRLAAMGLLIVALARPMIGTQRSETFVPSTDTMVSIDLSGSMNGAKLEGVRDAVRAYVEEQRRGTENRVGMVTFSDQAYLDVKLTTDYDALIAHLKELETTGSTAIGKSMLTAIAHFLELNALDLDGRIDPRAAEVQRLLRDQGLPAALAYAERHPDLLKAILQPERAKIVVLFSDGESNSGIDPQAAAEIAASLGVKIYTVGISDPSGGLDEAALRGVAEKTGAKFYRADDANAMRAVLLEISRLEKSPAKIVASVSVKDYTSLLALLAFLLIGAELALANTRLRTLYGVALALALGASPAPPGHAPQTPSAPAVAARAGLPLPAVSAVPPEVVEGNELYRRGRFAEALKKYGTAVERHPDVPEIYFNMADAYLRLGENAKADAAWAKYLTLTRDPKKQSQTVFNLGNSALRAGDAAKAIELYKTALRLDAGNQDAKWNLEALTKESEKKQENSKDPKKGKPGRQKSKPDAKPDGKSGDSKPDSKPGDGKSDDGKPGSKPDAKPDAKPGDKPGGKPPDNPDGKPAAGKPGDGKNDGNPGDTKSDGPPGDGKPGDDKDGQAGGGKPDDKSSGEKSGGAPGGDQPGKANPSGPKTGSDKLGQALGDQDKDEKDAARRGMTRKGSGMWAAAALPLAAAGQGVAFSSSIFLWAVGIGLPAAALLVAWGIKKRLEAARRLSPGSAPKTFRSWWGARRFLGKSALALAAAGLIGLAAGDPRGGQMDEHVNFGGKDIVVTVDGSYSMVYAEDGRMARTRKELDQFIARLQGTDRVGLVVFAGQARTASPISIDYGNFAFKINRLDVESRGVGEGSDLAAAIKFSAAHFETAKKIGDRRRILIVISDGDVPEGDLAAAIAAASKHGVSVYAIGVGDPVGTKIKVPTADGAGTEYLIDEKTGGPALTRLNEDPLRKLSERTGGAYFRAGDKTSIDDILSEVSRLEKGQQSDVIKSPRPIGGYLIWPALLMLLLDLVLPGRSLLKVPSQRSVGGTLPRPKARSRGTPMLGLALLPLGAWPQILPFAALATLVAGYLAADSWSGGALARRAREAWQSRGGFVEKGVLADLVHLYDLREADERRLGAFVQGWRDAKGPQREAMIAAAESDEALWREKLTAAYMSGAAPETLEKVLAALRRAARRRLEPLAPVTDRMSARRAQLSWMAHSDAETRLAALTAAAAGAPSASLSTARRGGAFSRLKRGASAAVLALMLALTGAAAIGTRDFRAEQRAAAEVARNLFYAEDLFVFSDRYIDERIAREVIPALQRWHESPQTAGSDFERALTILRESPDPKADNILVAVFRHVDVLPLTSRAESTLLRALIERESDALWDSMDALIAQSRADSFSSRMLVKLVMLGVESGNEKATVQLFRVLKSPNEQIRQLSADALYAHLSRSGGASFFDRLAPVQAKHALDAEIQMWTANFAFRRLSEPGVTEADLVQAKDFLDRALVHARALDARRVEAFKQAPPDMKVQAPPSMVAMLAALADEMQGGGAPEALRSAVRYFVSKAATDLIKEGEQTIPGLHDLLGRRGVVLPNTESPYDRSFDTTPSYREVYKLPHLASLRAALDELGGPIVKDAAQDNVAAREYLDRAATQIETLSEAGAKAGMMGGGSLPEATAEQLLPVLRLGDSTFAGHSFLRALRGAGLAPASGDPSSQLAYPEALDADQLSKLRETLLGIARSGRGWGVDGGPRTLTWSEKLYLAGALEAVDAARLKIDPAAAAPDAAGADPLMLARLSRAVAAHPKDADFALRTEKIIIERLANGPLDAEDANRVLAQVFGIVNGTEREAAAVAALFDALKLPNGAALAPTARARAAEDFVRVAAQAEKAFSAEELSAELIVLGVREGEYAWRGDVKLRHYRVLGETIAAAAAKAQTGGKALDARQIEALKAAKSLPRLEAMAAAAGAPAGDSPLEAAADLVNAILFQGHHVFFGGGFNASLRGAHLMPGAGDSMADYRQIYARADIEALRAWLAALAASGKGPGDSANREQFWDEKVYLAKALDRVDAILRASYATAPAAASRTLLETVLRPGEEALAVARLALTLEARPRDAALALEAQEAFLKIIAMRPGDAADADMVLSRVSAAVKGTALEPEALAALGAALKGPNGAALAPDARKRADGGVISLVEQAEAAFAGFDEEVLKTGLRVGDHWNVEFKLRHYRALRAAIEARAAFIKKPTAGQRAVIERARAILPLLETLGAAAGVPAGDSPEEAAAEALNPALHRGYEIFPGSVFNDKLREKGFMEPGSGNGAGDRKQAYTRQEVEAIRSWLKDVLASGQGWQRDGDPRALENNEEEALREALKAAERALAVFGASARPAASGKGLNAFAPLAAAALPGLAPWLIFAILGLGAAYLVWRLLPPAASGDGRQEDAREPISDAVIARHRRIELSARRMATAVNGGSFRSRFIGAGGTDFAEARPYQGEDLREVDWKTSAKKGELHAKKFELERDMPLMLVVDISRSGRLGTRGTDKRAVLEDAAAALALAAARSNVRVGAVLISDRVERVIPPRGGSRHAMTIVDELLKAEPAGSATDLKPGLEAAGRLLGSRAMVAVLSDFIAPDFKDALGALASRHDVRAVRVTDPVEMGPLPDVGLLPVVDAETGASRVFDTSSRAGRAEAAAAVERREAAVEDAFRAARLDPISISTEGDPLESLELGFHPKKNGRPLTQERL